MKILKEVRFLESLLILLEIRFVWNNGVQKHSLSIDIRCPVSGQFFLCCTESILCKELLRKTAETFQQFPVDIVWQMLFCCGLTVFYLQNGQTYKKLPQRILGDFL